MGVQVPVKGTSPDEAGGASPGSVSCWLYRRWCSLGSADEWGKGEGPAGPWKFLGKKEWESSTEGPVIFFRHDDAYLLHLHWLRIPWFLVVLFGNDTCFGSCRFLGG